MLLNNKYFSMSSANNEKNIMIEFQTKSHKHTFCDARTINESLGSLHVHDSNWTNSSTIYFVVDIFESSTHIPKHVKHA